MGDDFFEEDALVNERFGLKAGAFACGNEERKIDVRGDVLLADCIETVDATAMPAISRMIDNRSASPRGIFPDGIGRVGRSSASCAASHTSLSATPPAYRQTDASDRRRRTVHSQRSE